MRKSIINRFLILVVLPLFWGSTFLATKICLTDLPPIWMGAIRYFISSLIFLVVLISKESLNKSLRELKNYWYLFLAVGLVGTFFAAFFQNIGLRYTTASVSSLINTLEPVLVALLSVLILRERLPFIGVAGLIIAFIGGFILITDGNPQTLLHLDGSVKGNILILLSIISYAFYTIFTKLLVGRTDPINAVTFSSIIGTLLLICSALIMEEFPQLEEVSLTTWMAIFYLAIFPTCISLFLFNKLLTQVEASRVSIILFLIPVYGLILGVILLGDPLTPAMAIGGVFTIIGIWLIEYGPSKLGRKVLKSGQR
ncbi:hypothetical protein BBF96_05635 [Anoxybacter fermentans]|uniref:EamA domain-containing protein n=1 Tax=Anoxybacter fermentans TaxID=1323375 RepID=A0A3S9SX53_9FIRM|nr:EamA family transporter [Anoxybacter fermentans]AZR72917.1 hypothetical protein BBF96_05635 [Anoxybacter fermentans]